MSNLPISKKLQRKVNPFVTSHEISKFRNFCRFVTAFWRRKLLKFYLLLRFSGKEIWFSFWVKILRKKYRCAHWSIRISSFSWELILNHLKKSVFWGICTFCVLPKFKCNRLNVLTDIAPPKSKIENIKAHLILCKQIIFDWSSLLCDRQNIKHVCYLR